MSLSAVYADAFDKLGAVADTDLYPGHAHVFDDDGSLKTLQAPKVLVLELITDTPDVSWGRVDLTTTRLQVSALARKRSEALALLDAATAALNGYEPGSARELPRAGEYLHLSKDFFQLH